MNSDMDKEIQNSTITYVKCHNAIVYSLGLMFDEWLPYISERWNIVGVSDKNESMRKKANDLHLKFYLPNELKNVRYDDVVITSIRYDYEIKDELHSIYHIPINKLLVREQWLQTFFKVKLGNKNPDKTFLLMQRPYHTTNGLWSHLFALLCEMTRIDMSDVIPYVDLQSFPNQYLEQNEVGKKNAFEFWFRQASSLSLDEIKQSSNVILGYDWGGYLGRFPDGFDTKRMMEIWKKYFKINESAKKMINEATRKFLKRDGNGRVLGVLYRGSDYKALHWKYHSIQPELNEFLDLTEQYARKYSCDNIYLSTEDETAAVAFGERFGYRVSMTDQLRFSDTGNAQLSQLSFGREHEKRIRGDEYFTTIELLSKCDCLLTGIQAGAAMAYIINQGKYEHADFLWRGCYDGGKK